METPAPARPQYDEVLALYRYLVLYHRSMLTAAESRVYWIFLTRAKALVARPGSPTRDMLERGLGTQMLDPEVAAIVSLGESAFRKRIIEKLTDEHGPKVAVNRCPRCRRVVCTPRARQCLWCGEDWH